VKTLNPDFSLLLLKSIVSKLEQKQQDAKFTEALYKWLQSVFKFKAADLITEKGTIATLGSISKTVEDRTANFEKLIMLRGKLDLLLQLSVSDKKSTKNEPKYEAINVLDENEENETPQVEGVEVMDIKDYKKVAEMTEEPDSENIIRVPKKAEKTGDVDEDLPEVVEEMQDNGDEEVINGNIDEKDSEEEENGEEHK